MFTNPKKKLETLSEKATEAYYDGEFDEAERLLNECLELAEKIRDEDEYPLAGVLNTLAGVYRETNREQEALDAELRSLEIMERVCDPNDPDMAGVVNNIAQIYRNLGNIGESLEYFERALKMKRDAEEPDRQSIASTLISLAELYSTLGEDEKSLEAFENAVEMAWESGVLLMASDATIQFVRALLDSNQAERAQHVLKNAISTYEQSLRNEENKFAVLDPATMTFEMIKKEHKAEGTEPYNLLTLRLYMVMVEHRLGLDPRLPPKLPAPVKIIGRIYEKDPAGLADFVLPLATTWHFLAQETDNAAIYEIAEDLYRKVLSAYRQSLPPTDERIETTIENLKELYEDMGKDPALIDLPG